MIKKVTGKIDQKKRPPDPAALYIYNIGIVFSRCLPKSHQVVQSIKMTSKFILILSQVFFSNNVYIVLI